MLTLRILVEGDPDAGPDLPYLLSDTFVGRSDVLKKISDAFGEDCAAPVRFVISGMPGLGKTQVALKYGFDIQDSTSWHVFWLTHLARVNSITGSQRSRTSSSFQAARNQSSSKESTQYVQRWRRV